MTESQERYWGHWSFTVCAHCTPRIRQQLKDSNCCAIKPGGCDTWNHWHSTTTQYMGVHAKVDRYGQAPQGWKFSNTTRRKILKDIGK